MFDDNSWTYTIIQTAVVSGDIFIFIFMLPLMYHCQKFGGKICEIIGVQ